MQRRQTSVPRQWLIADSRSGSESELFAAVRRLPPGTGILLLHHNLPAGERRRLWAQLQRLARRRGLVLLDERSGAARVHDIRELTRAQLLRTRLLLLSPMFATRSHPQWMPLPRMRGAALTRLAKAPVLALGGMDEKRFRRLEPLGFTGWAGIDAWLRT